ncbi:MAG TPA: IclR family transcriptional regulator C-terminal domain-containing protein, partial [Usitatibacter sp.]|nr:IclR family transcriptional regulator C-terminal domain-containing protein [Usitatibacter sp.]
IRAQTQIGQLSPAWCTATGRAMLAFNPGSAAKVLAQRPQAMTPKTVTDPKRLRAILGDVAAKGYAVAKAENHPEMGGIAAPIWDHNGNVIAACGLAIPAFRMDRDLIDRCVPDVLRAAGQISVALGYQPNATNEIQHAA